MSIGQQHTLSTKEGKKKSTTRKFTEYVSWPHYVNRLFTNLWQVTFITQLFQWCFTRKHCNHTTLASIIVEGGGDGQWEASAGCCRTFPLKAGEEASLRLNYISLRQKPPALRWKKTFSGRILNWTWTHRRAIACWRRPQQGSSWQQTPGFAKLEQHYCNCDGFPIQASGQKDVLTNTRKTTPFRNLHFWFGTPTKRFSWYTLVQHRL